MLLCQSLHCCYNICTVVLDDSFNFSLVECQTSNNILKPLQYLQLCFSLQEILLSGCGTLFSNPLQEGSMSPLDLALWQHSSRCLMTNAVCLFGVYFSKSFISSYFFLHNFCKVGSQNKHRLWIEKGYNLLEPFILHHGEWEHVCDEHV